jgi:hypothetical protein
MPPLLREPLLQFFLLGGAIFGLYALVDDAPPPVAENVLVISESDAQRLAAEFEATWRRSPTAEELGFMIDERVREEVYVREAVALGLDRDDAVIRRRLQTKMEFLTESGAEALAPDEATLNAHLAAHPERFEETPLVAFEQVLLDDSVAPDQVARLAAQLDSGIDPGPAARPTLLPGVVRPSPVQVVDNAFGPGFFAALAALPPGQWSGPVETSFGRHLVRVTERRKARLPPLAQIRAEVEQDWRAGATARLRDERFQALLGRYEVVRPDPATVLAP